MPQAKHGKPEVQSLAFLFTSEISVLSLLTHNCSSIGLSICPLPGGPNQGQCMVYNPVCSQDCTRDLNRATSSHGPCAQDRTWQQEHSVSHQLLDFWKKVLGEETRNCCNQACDAEIGADVYQQQPQRNGNSQLEAVAAGVISSSLCGQSLKGERPK